MSLSEFHSMYLKVEERDGIAIICFTVKELSDDENIEQLGLELFALVEQFGCRKLILSLSGVEYLTSAVLGKMITLHRKLHRNEGTLVLCGLGDSVKNVLLTANLLEYFDVVDDIEDAMAKLS